MKKKIFISFDYDNDKRYKFLLNAWNENSEFEFSFFDHSSKEIQSNNISIIKAGLTNKIKQAQTTLVIVGKYANSYHKDRFEIGYKNWINFEIAKSKQAGNELIAVKIDRSYTSPEELTNSGASWAMSFTQNNIIKALRGY